MNDIDEYLENEKEVNNAENHEMNNDNLLAILENSTYHLFIL